MKSVYMTALSPAKGADGDLKRLHISCAEDFGWHSPLPLMVALNLWSASFPRDRVDTKGLKLLPSMELSGPVTKKDLVYLQLKNAEDFDHKLMFREIHGKSIPALESNSFINWEGLLLQTTGIKNNLNIENKSFQFRNWQLGLYKIRYDETRAWWENISCSCLWKVRKPM